MANERRWDAYVSTPITVNGTTDGIITVADTFGLYTKMEVSLVSNSQLKVNLQVKAVLSPTQVQLGPINGNLNSFSDLSAFLVSDAATIFANRQLFPNIKPDDIDQSTYAREPIVAKRNILVDKYGNYYDDNNPIPTNATFTGAVTVDLDAVTPANRPDPDNVLIAGSEDGTKAGTKHPARVDSNLDLRVGISNGANKANVNAGGELSVLDSGLQTLAAATNSLLAATNALLTSIDNGIPAALGPTVKANSMPVTMATDQPPIGVSLVDEPIKISGTENGQPGGTEFTLVNTLRQQILSAKDRDQVITYADFGTKNQRIIRIDYSASSIGTGAGFTARKTLSYVLDGNSYRRTNITWSLV